MPIDTLEQLAIISAVQNTLLNLIIDAVAGSGKTYTIVKALQNPPALSILTLAFNKSIQMELKTRLPESITCRTLSGHGYQAWRQKICKSITVETDKIRLIVNKLCDSAIVAEAIENLSEDADHRALIKSEIWLSIRDLIDGCRASLIVSPKTLKTLHECTPYSMPDFEDYLQKLALEFGIDILFPGIINLVADGLHICAVQAFAGLIDFNDMIWAPLCFKATFDKFQWIVVDEAQDLNEAQHRMIRKSLFPNSRLIIVGDPYQAIYGWRGAMTNSMELLQEEYSMQMFPLSFCFRCPEAVVEEAQAIVPHIQSWAGAKKGKVSGIGAWTPDTIGPNSVILCRTNAPLMRVGFAFLAEGKPIRFQNNRLGRSLKALLNKIGIETRKSVIKRKLFKEIPFADAEQRISIWLRTMKTKCIQNNSEHLFGLYTDQAACMKAIIDASPTMREVGTTLDELFDSPYGLVLSTIHGAKGLEWDHVFFLDAAQVPRAFLINKVKAAKIDDPDSSYTTKLKEQLQQEYNLKYVATTRALKTLTYIAIENLNKGKEDDC